MTLLEDLLPVFLSKLAARGTANGLPGKYSLRSSGLLPYVLFLLLGIFALKGIVQAQTPTGFISIDCGLSDNASYADTKTGLVYVSDAEYVDTGESKGISTEIGGPHMIQQLQNVRAFPEGERNCYKIPLQKHTKYLIRAVFLYGNYDGQNKAPVFDLHLGSNKWETVEAIDWLLIVSKEIIHLINMSYIDICLVNTGSGIPFISTLELRPVSFDSYDTSFGSLATWWRQDVGSTTDQTVRYPDDAFDRTWNPYNFPECTEINTSETIDTRSQNDYGPPSIVMGTAGTPANPDEPMTISIDFEDSSFQFLVYMHFAELVKLETNQSREFNISLNGELWYGQLVPEYLCTVTIFSPQPEMSEGQYEFTISKTENSTFPPILNAIEVYYILNFSQLQTNQEDVDAITNIKSSYGIKRNWQGDPCVPRLYLWQGLNCSYTGNINPRITSLNLSSSGLTGEIPHSISGLTSLESLDLSDNNLTGSVPDFLSQLPSLEFLNLTRNRLSGPIPTSLREKSEHNLFVLSVGGNQDLCVTSSCKSKKKNSVVVPVTASVAVVIILMSALAVLFCALKRRKQEVAGEKDARTSRMHESMESDGPHFSSRIHLYMEPKSQRFTYSEILNITNNFGRVLGKGGFGTVYHGYLNDIQVAVKVLSQFSAQGYKQFKAEVKLLLRVHHRNLTCLRGFCDEGTKVALVYEYMANGDLQNLLSGRERHALKWERRLHIAVEAAKGLEYLHNGCKPPIVHRDIKTSNILLDDKFQAKLADFGLSGSFPIEGGTHASTVIAGTPGYLDPEYAVTNWLTEKSDVYSFGVVLLKIITGKPVIATIHESSIHISQWVSSLLDNGDIRTIVDPCLDGDFNVNSIWKAVETAMDCASPASADRPTMQQVVTELTECLRIETVSASKDHEMRKMDSVNTMPESTPLAR